MKRYGKRIGRYLIIAAFIGMGMVLLWMSAAAWGSMVLEKDNLRFCLEQPVTISEALAAARQNQDVKEKYQLGETETAKPLDFCIWGQKEDMVLSNEALSRRVQVHGIFLCGNPKLLFSDSRVPVLEDKNGCLIDEETAWELFGSSQVAGKEISCEGKTYIIRNVVTGREKIIAFQVDGETGEKKSEETGQTEDLGGNFEQEEKLDRITVQRPEDVSVNDLELIWNSQYGLDVQLLDLELLRGIGGACLLLAPVTVCVFFGVYLYQQYRKQEAFPGKAAAAGAGLLLAVLLLLFLKSQVRIPDEYIPTRWSEFSFWTDLWKQKTAGMKLLLQISKAEPDTEWMSSFMRTLLCGILAELFFAAGGILLQHHEKE